jgi:rhomboid protease GluP
MTAQVAEIFRSMERAACNDRAFMLFAVGIPSAVGIDGGAFILLVDVSDAPAAQEHLRQYEIELRVRRPAPPPPLPVHPNAAIGSVAYVVLLLAVTYAISNGLGRLDAFDVGEMVAGRVRAGEWWRVWTALTLHLDGPHLAANSAAGAWFGYLAGRLLGVGNAWMLIVLGAGFANCVEALFGPSDHRSVGASTAVFTALGLLSAFSWRARYSWPQRWALRWGPLVAGLVMLGWLGSGGQDLNSPETTAPGVDVVAHVLGFVAGLGLGTLCAQAAVRERLGRVSQWLTGLAALLPIVLAWARALVS